MSYAVTTNNAPGTDDTEDLEALFDNIVMSKAKGPSTGLAVEKGTAAEPQHSEESRTDNVICRIGRMTRTLHDSLCELGYDKLLKTAAEAIPDARDHLSYVSVIMGKAAERTLNAAEAAKRIQDRIETEAGELSASWQKLFDKQLNVVQFKELAGQTRTYIDDVPNQTRALNAHLLEIMMAQDFQDLTGQVIKKITGVVQNLEQQLISLLVENMVTERKTDTTVGLMNGPVVNSDGRSDVVTSQRQVDELLESLGF